jgi:glycosyltransferase involved in cell wall biosynthesis
LSASRNRGFSQASGEFIAFLDADDLWTPDKLEAQLAALQDNPNAAVAYSWTDFIDETGQFLKPGPHFTISGDVYAELLRGNFLANGSNPLIRRQALIKVGSFDESLPAAEDWDIYLRLAAHYHFISVPFPQVFYRVTTNSMSSNLFKQEAASLQFIERAYAQAPESLQHLKKECFGFLYQYLIYKALEGSPGRQKGLKAAKLLWHYIKNAPSRHRLLRLKFSLLLKIMVAILLPHRPLQLDR